MEYMIVEADSPARLEDKVKSLLKIGWELQGGVATAVKPFATILFQAMVRKS